MIPYLPHTESEIREMLAEIGVSDLEALFEDIPRTVRLDRPLGLPDGLSEYEVLSTLSKLAAENRTDYVSFLGFGCYDHIIPSVVAHLTGRSEFYTSYTPYQAEMSQGMLQAIFEFQSMIAELTGLDASNASLYDGATAAAEGASIALQSAKKADTVLYSSLLHPFTKEVLRTHYRGRGVKLVELEEEDGVTSRADLLAKLSAGTAGVVVQSPNALGYLEDFTGWADSIHDAGALFVISANPLSLGAVRSPGEWGADVAVGDVQPFGLAQNYGGPSAGYIAVREPLLRKLPGRIVGKTVDRDGRRAFVLTLQAREQHIRRERATSNICSNQALAALAATVYLSAVGKEGLREVARQNMLKARFLFDLLSAEVGVKPLYDRPFFNEFTITLGSHGAAEVADAMRGKGFLAGVETGKFFPRYGNALTVAVTEKRTRGELERYAAALREVVG